MSQLVSWFDELRAILKGLPVSDEQLAKANESFARAQSRMQEVAVQMQSDPEAHMRASGSVMTEMMAEIRSLLDDPQRQALEARLEQRRSHVARGPRPSST